jgi:putative flippase GtrA
MRVKTYNLGMKKRARRHFKGIKKYIIVCGINGIIMFAILFLLTSVFRLHYLISLILVYMFVVTSGFLFNKYWIFNKFNPKRMHRLYYEFLVVSLIGFIVNMTLLYFLVDMVGVFYLLAQVIIVIPGFPIVFTLHKNIVFSHR